MKSDNDVIQTLRTAHQNQTQLNLMADQKANILIGTLALMFTVVLTRLITLTENKALLWCLVMFMLMQLISLILTVMVLIPKNISKPVSGDVSTMQNPLFFGFFTQFSQQQYSDYMQAQLFDNKAARTLIVNDIYQIGVILKRKYLLLRWAYFSALLGVLIPTVLGFTLLI